MQADAELVEFGPFTLETGRRILLAEGKPVALSSRCYDILELLVLNRDRVVARDEIIAHVWRGLTVAENNLSVQMSALRRILGEQAHDEALIINLPGRGYRFVAPVRMVSRPGSVTRSEAAPLGEITPVPPSTSRERRGHLSSPAWRTSLVVLILLMTCGGWSVWQPSILTALIGSLRAVPDARLTIAVHPLVPVGHDPRTADLAIRYTEAVLARFGIYEDLVLFPALTPNRARYAPHFQIAGTLHIEGSGVVLTMDLTDAETGRHLLQSSRTMPVAASTSEQSAAAMALLTAIRPTLFRAEAARRRGPPRDSVDFVVASHLAYGEGQQITELEEALSLAEQAVQRDPASRPARILLSLLLTENMLSRSAKVGNATGERALALVDGVLREQPRNFLYVSRRAYTLEALGRIEEAQATAELGLRLEPNYPILTARLGELLMLRGNLSDARALLQPDPNDTEDDTLATIAFADERYADAVLLSGRDVAGTSGDRYTHFPMLLEVAALAQMGKIDRAKIILANSSSFFPADLRFIGAQRQTAYLLPDKAWQRFRQGLAEAGIPP